MLLKKENTIPERHFEIFRPGKKEEWAETASLIPDTEKFVEHKKKVIYYYTRQLVSTHLWGHHQASDKITINPLPPNDTHAYIYMCVCVCACV
jgi:hypothetical protein